MEYTNGDVYNGQWDEGDIHGQGGINFKNVGCRTKESGHTVRNMVEERCNFLMAMCTVVNLLNDPNQMRQGEHASYGGMGLAYKGTMAWTI
ncbi:hypothetical protein OS493_040261, partial [Desmophyllum pertusum]